MRSIRTNNDVEGWHNKLNSRCGGHGSLNMYQLIQLLHEEARFLPLEAIMITEKKLSRTIRKGTARKNRLLQKCWDDYQKNLITVKELLESVRKAA